MQAELSDMVLQLFSIVEAIAVVASLIFVGIQVREARRVSSGGAYQSWLDTVNSFYSSLAQSQDLAYLYWKGRTDIAKLNEGELPRFFYLCVQWFALMENLFMQYHQRLIPDEFFRPWQDAFGVDLSDSGLQEYWRLERSQYSPKFQRFVDGLVASGESKSVISVFQQLTEGKIFQESAENDDSVVEADSEREANV